MHLCWVTLRVNDMKKSVEFYEKVVGLEIQNTFSIGDKKHFTFLGNGETQVELIHDEENTDVDMGKSISFGFPVDSVDKKMEFLKEKGVSILSGPVSPSPDIKFFYVLDPNGLKIQFVETIKG